MKKQKVHSKTYNNIEWVLKSEWKEIKFFHGNKIQNPNNNNNNNIGMSVCVCILN